MPISCHFRDCKALLVASPTRVRSAIASAGPFLLPFWSNTSSMSTVRQVRVLVRTECRDCVGRNYSRTIATSNTIVVSAAEHVKRCDVIRPVLDHASLLFQTHNLCLSRMQGVQRPPHFCQKLFLRLMQICRVFTRGEERERSCLEFDSRVASVR